MSLENDITNLKKIMDQRGPGVRSTQRVLGEKKLNELACVKCGKHNVDIMGKKYKDEELCPDCAALNRTMAEPKVEEAEHVFKAASPEDVDRRRAPRQLKIRARRAKDTVEDRVLGMEPEDIDPLLSMWFDEWGMDVEGENGEEVDEESPAARNKYVFLPFIRDAKTVLKIDLTPLVKRYLSLDEKDRAEVMFCQSAAARIAKAGFYVYDSDSRFEVYAPEDMVDVDYDEDELDEAQKPVFKAAGRQELKRREKLQGPMKTIKAPIVKNEEGDFPEEELVSIECPHCGSLEDHPAEERRWLTQHFDFLNVEQGRDGHEYTYYRCQDCGKDFRIKDMFESKINEAEPIFKAASQDQIAKRLQISPERTRVLQQYVAARFPNSGPYYQGDWAARFKEGMEWQMSDNDGRALLQKLGPNIYPKDIDAFFTVNEAGQVFKAAGPEEIAKRPHKTFKVIYKGDRENPDDYDNFTLDKTYDAFECHEADLSLDPVYKGDDPDAFIKLKNDLGQMVINPSIDFDFPVEENRHCKACDKDVLSENYLPDWRTVGVCKSCAETIEEAEKEIREERRIFQAASPQDVKARLNTEPCGVCGVKLIIDKSTICSDCGAYICDECTAWKDSDTPICNMHVGDDIDAAQYRMGEAVNEAGNPVFKAASKDDVAKRRGQKPLPAGTPDYKFLEFIVDPDPALSTWKMTGIGGYIDEEHSDIYFGKDGEPEFCFNMKTQDMIDDKLEKDDELTEECCKFFEDEGHGSFADKNEAWVESKKWTPRGTENTANWDSTYYWGEILQYTRFETDDGRDGVIIMMHMGGDYRGNYAYPVVYFGDFDEVISASNPGDPREEPAYLLGYDGDMDKLVEDMKNFRNPQAEEDEEGIEGAYRPQKDVKNRGQMKWTFNPENPAETQVESRVQEWKTDGSVTSSETRTSIPTPKGLSEKSEETGN